MNGRGWIKIVFIVLFLFISCALLRFQFLQQLHISFAQAQQIGFPLGIFYDFAFSLLPIALGFILYAIFRIPLSVGVGILSLVLWMAYMANTIYFRFFESQLKLWIALGYWRDLFVVKHSVGHLGFTLLNVLSAVAIVPVLFLSYRLPKLQNSLKSLSIGVGGVILFLLLRQAPVWAKVRVDFGSTLKQHILALWWEEALSGRVGNDTILDSALKHSSPEEVEQLRSRMAELRNFSDFKEFKIPKDASGRKSYSSVELRKKLGLKPQGPLNSIILYMESVRGFEFQHPELGPKIFPKLRALLSRHSIWYQQAYTSASSTAHLSSHANFSTACSLLPNLLGEPVYFTQHHLKATCLHQTLLQQGYRTHWFNTVSASYGARGAFGKLHGIQDFFDAEYFDSQGVTKKHTAWGADDDSFFKITFKKLTELSKQHQPFHADIITMTSHHPHNKIEGYPKDPSVKERFGEYKEYFAYLSTLSYVDESVAAFIEQFLQSDLSKDTVLFLLSDHSISGPEIEFELSASQREDAKFRIPLAIITRNLPRPQVVQRPVHQMDIAVTLASLINAEEPETWVGRNLLGDQPSPLLGKISSTLHYRFGSRMCHTSSLDSLMHCWKVNSGQDPMYATNLESVPEDTGFTQWVVDVISANSSLIVLNRFKGSEAK